MPSQRPSQVRNQLARSITRSSPETGTARGGSSSTGPASEQQPSKFTVLLDADAAAGFDELALHARRTLGRRVQKSDLVRALIHLVNDDPTIRDALLEELRGTL
jgi:hypothetical protein